MQQQLARSLAELTELREQIASDTLPLSQQLNELEMQLSQVRLEYQQKARQQDSGAADLFTLRADIKSRQDVAAYLTNLFGEYVRNFEARLHIAELDRYDDVIQAAKLAAEHANLPQEQVYAAQAALLETSLGRLEEALGGTRFQGTAVDGSGLVKDGTFALVGPVALFRAKGTAEVGTAEQLRSLEPAVIRFNDPEDARTAIAVVDTGSGLMPVDTTLGNAHKFAATQETLLEHIRKGGPVMVPILALAAAALLLGLFKWLALARLRRPSRRQIDALLETAARGDQPAAKAKVAGLPGPVGRMLEAGVEHMHEPRELIEEVMYENVLKTRHRVQSFLPFISICAASAPLLGLLGTVTGIIDTFKVITVVGTGDPKTLSGGISEALITTEFGLIVAIPSLLLYAFLSRKARGILGDMETTAVGFVNQISASRVHERRNGAAAPAGGATSATTRPDPSLVRRQVHEILSQMLGPVANGGSFDDDGQQPAPSQAG